MSHFDYLMATRDKHEMARLLVETAKENAALRDQVGAAKHELFWLQATLTEKGPAMSQELNIEAERELFEPWYTGKFGKPDRLGDTDQYRSDHAQGFWMAWQASASARRATVPAAQQAGWVSVGEAYLAPGSLNRTMATFSYDDVKPGAELYIGAPAEAPNFCPRCGKRPAADSVHTCTPSAEAASVPKLTGDELRAIVRKAHADGSDGTSPQEYVHAGWDAAIRALQGKPEAAKGGEA